MSLKKNIITLLLLFVFFCAAHAQVGIGTNDPDSSALLELNSTNKGFLPPRVSTHPSDPAKGLIVYFIPENCLQVNVGTPVTPVWQCFDGSGAGGGGETLNISNSKGGLFQISPYFVMSLLDSNYFPYLAPTSQAILPGTAADDPDVNPETNTLDVQGTITTTGVTIKIPYASYNGTLVIPPYTETINIPASYTEDGNSRDLTFSYTGGTFTTGVGYMDATLKAEGGDLLLKKMDLNTGLGDDGLGFKIATFNYGPEGDTFGFDVRIHPGQPDKYFGVDGEHDFVYPLVTLTNGDIWIAKNLGADFNNVNRVDFNPTNTSDVRGNYGSLWQWGRDADGHELVNWDPATPVEVHGNTTTQSTTINHPSKAYVTDNWYIGTTPDVQDLWKDDEKTTTDPCPPGYKVPSGTDYRDSRAANVVGSIPTMPRTGHRWVGCTSPPFCLTGSRIAFWTSTATGSATAERAWSNTTTGVFAVGTGSAGYSIRCIKM